MSYINWFNEHGSKHTKIIKKLTNKTKEEIIEYFKYENMVKNEPDFCPLYVKNRRCHSMENLNCYLCACPNFRFKDSVGFKKKKEKKLLSYCSIDSKDGRELETKDAIHQNCTNCLVPHKEKLIKKIFNKNWFEIMSSCSASSSSTLAIKD